MKVHGISGSSVYMVGILKHESSGLGGRSEGGGNAAFERHGSCDKCSAGEFLTRFAGIVKGELQVHICV